MSYTGKTGFQQPVALSAGSNYNANGVMGLNFWYYRYCYLFLLFFKTNHKVSRK